MYLAMMTWLKVLMRIALLFASLVNIIVALYLRLAYQADDSWLYLLIYMGIWVFFPATLLLLFMFIAPFKDKPPIKIEVLCWLACLLSFLLVYATL